MKFFRLILVLLMLSVRGWGAIAYVGGTSGKANDNIVTLTYSPAAGNLLVIVTLTTGQSVTSINCTGASCTATAGVSTTGNYFWGYIHYIENVPSGVTAINVNGSTGQRISAVAEFSGVATSSSHDQGNAAYFNGTTDADSGNITTTNADDLMVFGVGGGSSVSSGPSNSFAGALDMGAQGDMAWSRVAYRIVSSTGTYNSDYTLAGSSQGPAMIESFKAAAGGGPPPARRVILVGGM